MPLKAYTRYIMLADDDKDDNALFQEILEESSLSAQLIIIRNGEELVPLINDKKDKLPDILFPDLNMPHKNGFECLGEIKQTEKAQATSCNYFQQIDFYSH